MAIRVGDKALYNRLQLQIQTSQYKVSNYQIQASTGRAAQNYSEISEKANYVVSLENSFIRNKRYQDNIKTVDTRINEYESSVSHMQDIAERLKVLLTNALNGNNAGLIDLSTQSLSLMEELQSELNKQFNGQYIFSGTQTTTRPVDIYRWGNPMPIPVNLAAPADYTVPALPATPTAFPTTAGANATHEYFGYYYGNTARPTVRADDNLTVTYGLTASDPIFAQMIYALRLSATIGAAPAAEQRDRMQGAMTLLDTVIPGLADKRTDVGSQGRLLLETNKKHDDFLASIEGLIQDIQGADIPQTMAKLSAEQTQLEASFLTIARINNVSLVNYLR